MKLMNRVAISKWILLPLFGLLSVQVHAKAHTGASDAAQSIEEAAALEAVLGPILSDRALAGTRFGVQVVNVNTGEEVFSRNADEALSPASVMKVMTAATALRTLGPGHRFSTYISTEAEQIEGGVLDGDVFVRGHGDPTLVTEKVWRMVADLKALGVHKIDGDVLFDDTYFDKDRLIQGWRKKLDMVNGPAYFAPLGALSVNFNTVALLVGPGDTKGAPGNVMLETPVDLVLVANEVTTGGPGSRKRFSVEREVDSRTGKMTLTVSGTVPAGSEPVKLYRSITKPRAYFMQLFEYLMDERGIEVTGKYKAGKSPKGARILTRMDSDALPVVLARMNKHSSNFMAEHVLKAVGAEAGGAPGTTDKGLEAVEAYLADLGNDVSDIQLVNGSGLSRDLRLRASHITSVLIDMFHDRKVGPEFMSSLAIGGVDGTLWTRFRGEGVAGRLRGKTGSLNFVHCLAGYVDGGDGDMYAFAFLVNDIAGSLRPVRRVHDRFGDAMLRLSAMPAELGDGS
jgi:D-alanyl-D-alanine carboxypeptidase/D-alanyl-D-alanine-endopeptidase (penicillin-binding protein 4)